MDAEIIELTQKIINCVKEMDIDGLLKIFSSTNYSDLIVAVNGTQNYTSPLGYAYDLSKENTELTNPYLIMVLLLEVGAMPYLDYQAGSNGKLTAKRSLNINGSKTYEELFKKIRPEQNFPENYSQDKDSLAVNSLAVKRFIQLYNIDNPYKSDITDLLLKHNIDKERFKPIYGAVVFNSRIKLSDLARWYLESVFFKNYLKLKHPSFDKKPYEIVYSYLLDLKRQKNKSKNYNEFVQELAKHKQFITDNKLDEEPEVSAFWQDPSKDNSNAFAIAVNKMLEAKPREAQKTVKKKHKNSPQSTKLPKDIIQINAAFFDKFRQDIVRNTSIVYKLAEAYNLLSLLASLKIDNKYQLAFANLSKSYTDHAWFVPKEHSEQDYKLSIDKADVAKQWNLVLAALLQETHHYFYKRSGPKSTLKKQAQSIMQALIESMQVELLGLEKIIDFLKKLEFKISKSHIFGSYITNMLANAFGIKNVKPFADVDLHLQVETAFMPELEQYLMKELKTEVISCKNYKNGKSIKVNFQGLLLDLTCNTFEYLPNGNCSLKSFAYDLSASRLIVETRALSLLFRKEISFKLSGINKQLLAFYFREIARQPDFKVAIDFIDYLDNADNSQIVQAGSAIFLTKYVVNITSNCCQFFQDKLLKYFNKLIIMPEYFSTVITGIAEKTAIVKSGVNYFASLFLAANKLENKKLDIMSLPFPEGVKRTAQMLVEDANTTVATNHNQDKSLALIRSFESKCGYNN